MRAILGWTFIAAFVVLVSCAAVIVLFVQAVKRVNRAEQQR